MGASASDKLKPKLAVRAQAHELQNRRVQLSIDQDQIGSDMTIPVIFPSPDQGMVAVFFG